MKGDYRVRLNEPTLVGGELERLGDALASRRLDGDGAYTRRCSEMLESSLGVPKALLTTSCTHALEMCALLLDIGPGDEVIVPSFTFVSTANAFATRGATPVFVDVRRDTLNLDERLVADKLSPRTRAIVAVHYGGVACDMHRLLEISQETGVAVIEDNAHGLFSACSEGLLGTLGALGCLSFHATKAFTCGEGGALLINRADWVERAEILREKGTDRSAFMRGAADRYTWVDFGSSYLPSELQAAFLSAQLERSELVLERFGVIMRRYREALGEWAATGSVELGPEASTGSETSIFYLILPTSRARGAFIEHLARRGIQAAFHYLPLHLSRMGRSFGGRQGDCPVTELVAERLVRLPVHYGLTKVDQDLVIEAVLDFEAGDGVR